MLEIFLIIMVLLSLVYLGRILLGKFRHLANINIDNLPDIKIQRQKEAILKVRLQRSWKSFWLKIKENNKPWQDKIYDHVRQSYQRLKNVEKDLRRRGHEELSSLVDKSQNIEKLLNEAKTLMSSEAYQKAEEVLLEALSYDQHNIEVYKLLAEVYRGRKEYTQAKETLEYLLKLTHNEDASVYSSLAEIARQRGNLKEAEEEYLRSISLSEDNYLYFLSLAETYLDLEEEAKSLETAQRALILSPNNPKILDFLINLSIIMQDKELASKYLNKLKEVNPENNKILEFAEHIDSLK
jgi:tetratricopeptide (TPR) repeat protein